MTAESFNRWIKAMKAASKAQTGHHCGRMLGVSPTTLENYKKRGGSRMLALACSALLYGKEPYGQ